MKRAALSLSRDEQQELSQLAAQRNLTPNHLRRVRVVLLSAQGVAGIEIARCLDISAGQVSRIRRRFVLYGVAGLATKPHSGRRDHAVSSETIARILSLSESTPPSGLPRWSTRLIAARVGLTSTTVAKVLRRERATPSESVSRTDLDQLTPRTQSHRSA